MIKSVIASEMQKENENGKYLRGGNDSLFRTLVADKHFKAA